MKRSLIWLAMFATACNSASTMTTSPQSPVVQQTAPPVAQASSQSRGASSVAKAASGVQGMATIPVGARYSIFCDSFGGPDHVAQATEIKNLLVRNSQLHDWYVVHQASQSTLYEGYYKEVNPQQPGLDNATKLDAQRARRERALVEAIPDPRSPERKLFPGAQFYLLDSPDPEAPAAWSLTNAPGYWSVQVAAFTGYDRKQKTIEAVRQARAMNPPVEAYYYHGGPKDSVSIVCVGSWPADAIQRQAQSNTSVGTNPNDKIVVDAGEVPLTPEQIRQMTGNDPNVRVLRAKADILDPTLKQTLLDYPIHAVDGADQMVPSQDEKGNVVMVPRPSMIVPIPHGQPAEADRGGTASADDAPPTLLNPNGSSGSGDLNSRLKGLGR